MIENMYELAAAARAREREQELRSAGYSGKNLWMVAHRKHGAASIFAPSAVSAIWRAAELWGEDPRKAVFHQDVVVRRQR